MANAIILGLISVTSNFNPDEYASSNIFAIKSIEGFVPGCISFRKFLSIRLRNDFSLFIASKLTTFSSFKGNPEDIVAMGISLQAVSLLLRLELPVNTLISISLSYNLANFVTSPS